MSQQANSFSAQAHGISRGLYSVCGVCSAYDPTSGTPHPKIQQYKGLWDTGASGTVITKKIVDELGLKPIGKAKAFHANGESIVDVYMVNIFLPNQVAFPMLRVTEGKLSGTDILIGMDIITQGDFAVSNFGGKTMFSFRIPSLSQIDFCKSSFPSQPAVSNKQQGRNDSCDCGSGKKYKHCHGKQ